MAIDQDDLNPQELFRLTVEDLLDEAMDKQCKEIESMCNMIKRTGPETIELSKEQHKETLDIIGALIRALYIACGVITGLCVVITGCLFFAITALLR